jgi:23S rRNA pseudouridine2605 synthase
MQERLQKILAHAGVASRRAAEKMIAEGRVTLNGEVVTEMGIQADPRSDDITFDGQRIRKASKPAYILLNKPRNVMSTLSDPEGRPTLAELIRKAPGERLYPVGRLDFISEGLLFLTNDGEFTRFMTKAGSVPKVYRVKTTGQPTAEAVERLRRGMRYQGAQYAPCKVEVVKSGPNTWFEVTLKQGKNHQVRNMFEAIGHRVMTLRRTRIGFIEGGTLGRGKWRELEPSEVARFYSLYGKKPDTAEPVSKKGWARPAASRANATRKTGASGRPTAGGGPTRSRSKTTKRVTSKNTRPARPARPDR